LPKEMPPSARKIFDEIHKLTVEVANSYSDPEAIGNALPRLEDALKRLQTERAETHRDLKQSQEAAEAAKEKLEKERGICCDCG
jgi:chromosome segregation ATPase